MIKIGCNAGYLFAHFAEDLTFEDIIWGVKRAAELGFKNLGLEVYIEKQKAIYTDKNIKEIKKAYRSLGLDSSHFIACSMREDLVSLNGKRREEGIRSFKECVTIAERLELPSIVVLPSATPPEIVTEYMKTYPGAPPACVVIPKEIDWASIWRENKELLSRCLAIVKKAGMKLALEPCPHNVVSNTEAFLRMGKEIDSEAFGIYMDTAHLFVQKESIPVSIEKCKGKIFGLGICDNDGCNDYHWPPGKGKIDWSETIFALRKVGYDGYLDLEINVSENPDDVYLKAKRYLKKILERSR